jgi:uroporphyrinogen-III synthase
MVEHVVAACVGPVTAAPLGEAGIPVVQPDRSRLGALVREIVEQVPLRRGLSVSMTRHLLDVRGQAVVVDGSFVPLPATSAALLRELARRPGHVVLRPALLRLLPGDGVDGHAVDVAIGRLRHSLGDGDIVQTVVKRGYRLAVETAR